MIPQLTPLEEAHLENRNLRSRIASLERIISTFHQPKLGDTELVNSIITWCEDEFALTKGSIRKDRKPEYVVKARHAAMYLARTRTNLALNSLADLFNRHDHTTIFYAVQACQDRMEQCERYKTKVEKVDRKVLNCVK